MVKLVIKCVCGSLTRHVNPWSDSEIYHNLGGGAIFHKRFVKMVTIMGAWAY